MNVVDILKKIRGTEKEGAVSRRACMLIILFGGGNMTFVSTAATYNCDRRTVALWCSRFKDCRKSIKLLRRALSDKPRSGRPPKIKLKFLQEAQVWCKIRAFTILELRDKLEELSSVRLSQSQVRRYAHRWGYTRKKSSSLYIAKSTKGAVRNWRSRLLKKIEYYRDKGYAIATQDESHFMDAVLSKKYWAELGLRIFMSWSGGHHRFSMLCTMTMDGRTFFDHCHTVNTESFLEHIDKVYQEVGKMVLVLDKASWHSSKDAKEFFRKRDIIVLWYPTGHPYLNPVEEVWNVLKSKIDHSIRYADKKTHLEAVYKFVNGKHVFDYDLVHFWKRRAPKGVIREFIKSNGEEPDPIIQEHQVGSTHSKRKPSKK